VEFIYPRGGWHRAIQYITHRVRRLPDAPHRIARGVFAGFFISFTPFFGLHLVIAALMAKIMRGNIIAALLATFIGNPLTFPFIAAINLKLGKWILGHGADYGSDESLFRMFSGAGRDLKQNLFAHFTGHDANWQHLHIFFNEVFLPYLCGGIIVGVLVGLAGYYLTLPVIAAYQNRRKGRLKKKLADLHRKAAKKPGEVKPGE